MVCLTLFLVYVKYGYDLRALTGCPAIWFDVSPESETGVRLGYVDPSCVWAG